MNIFWMAAITLLVIIEKMTHAGIRASRISGVGMALYGSWLAIRAIIGLP